MEEIVVVHVDDQPEFLDLAATLLEREDDRFRVETATSPSDGLATLEREAVDCVVSDYDMPTRTGIEFLQTVRETHPDLPFLLFTGKGSEEIASEAISAGVTDYLQKSGSSDQYTVLANRIRNAVEKYRMERELDRTRRQYRKVVEQNFVGIYIIQDGEFVYVNPKLAEIHGYERDTVLDLSPVELVAPEERERVRENLRRRMEGDVDTLQYRTVGLTSGGDRIDIELHGSRIQYDGAPAVIGAELDISERIEHERERERQRSRLTALFESFPEPTVTYAYEDDEPRVTGVNEAFTETFGYDESAAVGEHIDDLVVPRDRRAEAARLDQRVRAGESVDAALTRQTRDGPGDFLFRNVPLPEDEEIDGYGIYADITDRRERERELERQRELFEQAQALADVGAWEWDPRRGDGYYSEHVPEIFGLEAGAEPTLADIEACYHPADRESVREAFRRAIEDGETYSVAARVVDADGHERWVRTRGDPQMEDGTCVRLYGTVQDVTGSKRQEQKFAALRRASREMMQCTTEREVAEVTVDVAKTVLGYIKAAVRLVDGDGTVLRTVATTENNVAAAGERPDYGVDEATPAARTYRRGEPTIYDDLAELDDDYDRGSLRSGLYVPVGDHGVFSCGESEPGAFDDSDVEFVAVLTKLAATTLTRLDADQMIRNQNERLEEFTRVVSHDLRNPLQVAESRLELAREDCESEHLASIGRAHDRMWALIDDLLTLAREGEGETDPEPVALAEFVETRWQTVDTASATLRTDVDRTIWADRSRLGQLLENLVRNAVEHGGPEVTVTVGGTDDGFYVADDGPGIPAADREEVFDAGYSTARSGTGFGLSIVERVAQAHGWTVDVTAASGGGTRFEVTGVESAGE